MITPKHGSCDADKLLELMRAGDISALEEISKCFGEQMFRVGRARCSTYEMAQDAVQDVMLAAGQNLKSFRGEGSLEGWLLRMVVNACHRSRRGRKNDPSWNAPMEAARGEAAPDDPEEEVQRRQLRAELQAALATLSVMDRSLLMLADVQGWKGPELAAEVGLAPTAIRARLSRARRKLRSALSDVWAEFDPGLDD